MGRAGRILKRSFDIFAAGSLLILALPLFAVCAVIIKLDSEGPVLFRQPRMGRGFTLFRILKFRTMTVCESGSRITLGKDDRITRAGAFLRRNKLDELPQLWNVLRGEMSLVGTRPVIPELACRFRNEYTRLLRTRPGLTDPATIRYCREADLLALVPDPMDYFLRIVVPDKLHMSLAYQESATVASDLRVVALTLAAMVPPNALRRPESDVPEADMPCEQAVE